MNSYLEDMAPVLALVVEPLIDHLHDLYEIVSEKSLSASPFPNNNDTCAICTQLVIRQLRDFVHLGARWTPGIVRGGIANFSLGVRVPFCVVFRYAEGSLAKMLHGGKRNRKNCERRLLMLSGNLCLDQEHDLIVL